MYYPALMPIDKITCLCYDKRKDLWPALHKQFVDYYDKDVELFVAGDGQDNRLVYDHVDTLDLKGPFLYNLNKGHYNAFLCHKKMAQRAIDEGVRNVLFLEDDSYVVKDRAHLLYQPQFNKFVTNEPWDIIYLGWWQKKTPESSEDRDDLEELWKKNQWAVEPIHRPPEVAHEICALHGLLINKHFLPVIANAPAGPIDSFLLHNFDRLNIKAYFLWPKVIHVHSTWSFCEGSQANRNKI